MFRKALSFFLSACLLGHLSLGSIAEANVWTERRQLAALPASIQLPVPQRTLTLQPSSTTSISSQTPDLDPFLNALPESHGRIESVHPRQHDKGSVVILFQDIHANAEAQFNLSHLLQSVLPFVDEVGVEGAFAPLSFSRFHAFPDKEITQRVATAFVEKDLLAAASYTGMIYAGALPSFRGIDDAVHHKANVDAYVQSANQQENRLKRLSTQLIENKEKKRNTFNATLRELDDIISAYQNETLSFGPYLEKMSSYRSPPQQIRLFLKTYRIEKKLNFDQVERERRRVVQTLAQRLNSNELQNLASKSLAYRLGQISFADFHHDLRQLCREKNVDLKSTPAFSRYVDYVLLADKINAVDLFDELDTFEKKIVNDHIQTSDEKKLFNEGKSLHLSKKLIQFQLTPNEWNEYKTNAARSTQHAEQYKSFEAFYEHADIRSQKMVANLNLTDERKSIALISGGFHTPLLTQQLKEKGHAVIVVSPHITEVNSKEGSAYLSFFSQEKTPIEKLFEGDTLFVANPAHQIAHPLTDRHVRSELAASTLEAGAALPDATGTNGQVLNDGVVLVGNHHYTSETDPASIPPTYDLGPQRVTQGFHLIKKAGLAAVLFAFLWETLVFHYWGTTQLPGLLVTLGMGTSTALLIGILFATIVFSLLHMLTRLLVGSKENTWRNASQNFALRTSISLAFFTLPFLLLGASTAFPLVLGLHSIGNLANLLGYLPSWVPLMTVLPFDQQNEDSELKSRLLAATPVSEPLPGYRMVAAHNIYDDLNISQKVELTTKLSSIDQESFPKTYNQPEQWEEKFEPNGEKRRRIFLLINNNGETIGFIEETKDEEGIYLKAIGISVKNRQDGLGEASLLSYLRITKKEGEPLVSLIATGQSFYFYVKSLWDKVDFESNLFLSIDIHVQTLDELGANQVDAQRQYYEGLNQRKTQVETNILNLNEKRKDYVYRSSEDIPLRSGEITRSHPGFRQIVAGLLYSGSIAHIIDASGTTVLEGEQYPAKKRAPPKEEADTTTSSHGFGGASRAHHLLYHEQGQFEKGIRAFAERAVEAYQLDISDYDRKDGLIDMRGIIRKVGGRIEIGDNKAYVTADNILVLLLPDYFKEDHAGRGEYAVYARTPAAVEHEITELRLWAEFAKQEGIANDDQINEGKLGERLRAWLNGDRPFFERQDTNLTQRLALVRKKEVEFHHQGLLAEAIHRAPNLTILSTEKRAELMELLVKLKRLVWPHWNKILKEQITGRYEPSINTESHQQLGLPVFRERLYYGEEDFDLVFEFDSPFSRYNSSDHSDNIPFGGTRFWNTDDEEANSVHVLWDQIDLTRFKPVRIIVQANRTALLQEEVQMADTIAKQFQAAGLDIQVEARGQRAPTPNHYYHTVPHSKIGILLAFHSIPSAAGYSRLDTLWKWLESELSADSNLIDAEEIRNDIRILLDISRRTRLSTLGDQLNPVQKKDFVISQKGEVNPTAELVTTVLSLIQSGEDVDAARLQQLLRQSPTELRGSVEQVAGRDALSTLALLTSNALIDEGAFESELEKQIRQQQADGKLSVADLALLLQRLARLGIKEETLNNLKEEALEGIQTVTILTEEEDWVRKTQAVLSLLNGNHSVLIVADSNQQQKAQGLLKAWASTAGDQTPRTAVASKDRVFNPEGLLSLSKVNDVLSQELSASLEGTLLVLPDHTDIDVGSTSTSVLERLRILYISQWLADNVMGRLMPGISLQNFGTMARLIQQQA